MIDSQEDLYLFTLIRQGDKGALENLFNKYYSALYRFAFGLTKRKTVAEEIVIDVFAMIWEKREVLAVNVNIAYHLFTLTQRKSAGYAKEKLLSLGETSS
jgi:RNA polymerase sigma-70 factor (ECF subfamily)